MSDVFVGDTNRDIAIGLHGCVDYWEKPVGAGPVLEWFRRILGERFPTPGTSAVGGPSVGDAATVGDPEPWGNRPTNVTPVGSELFVEEAIIAAPSVEVPVVEEPVVRTPTAQAPVPRASSASADLEEEAEDLGATPLPSGESRYNATTRVATAGAIALGIGANDATPVPSDSGALSALRAASEAVETPAAPPVSEPEGARETMSSSVHVVFARSSSRSDLPEPETEIPSLFDGANNSTSGSFEDTTFAAVFAAELERGTTGVVKVERNGVSKELFLDGGNVVGLRSDSEDDSLSVILQSDGLLRADQAQAITRNLGVEALAFPETYADANVIRVDDIAALEVILIRRRVHEVFGWTDGQWSVSNQRCPSSVRVSVPVPGHEIFRDGVAYGADTETVRQALSPQLRCPIVWTGSKPEVELLEWQSAIVEGIDGVARTSSVILGAPDRDEALRFIAALAIEGRIGFMP